MELFPTPPRNDYQVIYADPAWTHLTWSTKGKARSPEQHYDCMTLDDIKAIPVADWCAKDAALFIWGLDHMLPHTLEVIEAWGFEFKTVAFNWVKLRKRFDWNALISGRAFVDKSFHVGMGYWTRANPELCLFATRGKPKRVSKSVRRLVVDPVREHSRKPDRIRDDIVSLCGDVPRLEMFARSAAPGWDVVGNETEKFSPTPSLQDLPDLRELPHPALLPATGSQPGLGFLQ
ncbi:Transcriptional activator, adenine-specific DNA methyltransferase [Roseibium aggregatum]|uniref:Transcriptional activator, adenine-specific DNA methyltransferase n=2 Tax=Roseibium aggregatum TaxID=187304 RepID=A0A0M6Y8L0_9HYPH|nr:Transcriptional activator, adenine-specific DNA methyltransferase [Roseibium aggregatum]